MKPIKNWKKAWRMFSVQSMSLAAAIQGSWMALSEDMKATIPFEWVCALTITVIVLGIFGRLVKQEKVSGEDHA